MSYIRKKDCIYRDPKTGRIMKHDGYAVSYYWSETMLGYLRRNFPTTTNQELAEWLGVSPSTVIRKARELGLYKDPDWMAKKSSQNGKIGAMVTRLKGNSGQIKKGEHRNPAGEFKPGHKSSPEAKAKIAEAKKRYYRETPARILHERGLKAWETRRRKLQEALAPSPPPPSKSPLSPL